MDHATFEQFRTLVYEQSGIRLSTGKESLVCSRLSKRMRHLGIAEEQAYLRYIQQDRSGEELVEMLDAISTNVTHFFREPDHFDLLADFISRRFRNGGQRLFKFWSAACSSGEEPYSMAMTALETAGNLWQQLDFRILATDISTRVLALARQAEYRLTDLKSVPNDFRGRFFEGVDDGQDRTVRLRTSVQQLITFRRLNLARPPFPMQGPLDVVFCRNVMIYFDAPVRNRLLNEIERLLAPGGLLMVGHTESLAGVQTSLKTIKPSVYQKPEGA